MNLFHFLKKHQNRCTLLTTRHVLKGQGKEANFLEFLHKLDPHRPLHCLSSRSDFSFQFVEIFVIEERLHNSASQGVDKIAYRYNFFKP
jgi:hypothetical protein